MGQHVDGQSGADDLLNVAGYDGHFDHDPEKISRHFAVLSLTNLGEMQARRGAEPHREHLKYEAGKRAVHENPQELEKSERRDRQSHFIIQVPDLRTPGLIKRSLTL